VSAQCSEKMARVFTEVLLGDAEFPIAGQPAYTYCLVADGMAHLVVALRFGKAVEEHLMEAE
jgi:hypothetical protein